MNDMTQRVFSQKIMVESSSLVSVYLRETTESVSHKQGEVILDLNHSGSWVQGLEIVGGFVPFSVAKAISPFEPVRPTFPDAPKPGTVTYDPEADAAFIFLEYDPSFAALTLQAQRKLKKVSHSVNPVATYGLDERGGLVWIKIPVADQSKRGQAATFDKSLFFQDFSTLVCCLFIAQRQQVSIIRVGFMTVASPLSVNFPPWWSSHGQARSSPVGGMLVSHHVAGQ